MASPLSRLEQLVARAPGDLQGAGVHREPRFTRDVDVVVEVMGDREA